MDKKKSDIWKLFSTTSQTDCAKCALCHGIFSFKGGSVTNLKRHIMRKHPASWLSISSRTKQSASSTTSLVTENSQTVVSESNENIAVQVSSVAELKQGTGMQSTLSNFIRKPIKISLEKQINEQLVKMIVSEYHPLSLVEDKEFKKLLKLLNPNYSLPSRKTLSNSLLPELYLKIHASVKEALCRTEYVAITTDGWTSINNDSYQAVTVHFIDENSKLKAFLLDCHYMEARHTAENLRAEIEKVLDEWGLTKKLVAVVSDNASNITAAIRISGWQHIPCVAHSLNLIAQRALQEIKPLQSKVKAIVESFKRSAHATAKLKSLQKQMQYPELKLKQDVSTRWNSTFDMFERILEIKEPLLSTLAVIGSGLTLDSREIETIKYYCKLLKPFKDITQEISGESGVTSSKIILLTKMLQLKITNIIETLDVSITEDVRKMAEILLHEIKRRFSEVEQNIVCSEATFLDPRFKNQGFTSGSSYNATYERIKSKVATMIMENESVKNQNQEAGIRQTDPEPMSCEDSIWNDFDTAIKPLQESCIQNPKMKSTVEIDRYLQTPLLNRKLDPLKWWDENRHFYPNLFHLMRTRLCVPATSVPCERIFSKTGQIITERRNRLSTSKVKQLVFLNHNVNNF